MYLTIDIGATKTEVVLFSNFGFVKRKFRFFTNADPNKFTADITNRLEPFTNKEFYDIKSIVVAIPGIVQNNQVVKYGNLPWHNFHIQALFQGMFHCPVYLENDANLAALYEAKNRRGRSIYLTFSTGIGGGIVENNQLDPNSGIFEPGHVIYKYDNQELEWEDIASAKAISSTYGYLDNTTNEPYVFRDIALRVSLGLTDIIKELRPDTIIIGGPVGAVLPKFIKPLKKILIPAVGGHHAKFPKIIKAKRPMGSVPYGCYLYAKSKKRP